MPLPGAPHGGAALLRRTSVLPAGKTLMPGGFIPPEQIKSNRWSAQRARNPKRRTRRSRVLLFGGDTQTRTGGGDFADLCLTTWLCRHIDNRSNNLLLLSFVHGAGDEARTRYLHLGKVALYQMSYTRMGFSLNHSMQFREKWCLRPESNQRHGDFQSPALPTELQRQMATRKGLEPSTSGVTGRRSNQLNYHAICKGNPFPVPPRRAEGVSGQRPVSRGNKVPPRRHILRAANAFPQKSDVSMVGTTGLEPVTSCL